MGGILGKIVFATALITAGPVAATPQPFAMTAGRVTAADLPTVQPCTAAAPAQGQQLTGVVLQVIDGATLCVAHGPLPSQWVLVRLAGPQDIHARGALMAAAFAKDVICTVQGAARQGVVARCETEGGDLGALSRTGVTAAEAARWR
jgi:hypothetical protein